MIDFFSGAVSMGFVVAAAFFVRFWLRTADRFFLAFAIAFLLFAANQLLASWIGAADEHIAYTYLLRVFGYLLIVGAILDKNRKKKTRAAR